MNLIEAAITYLAGVGLLSHVLGASRCGARFLAPGAPQRRREEEDHRCVTAAGFTSRCELTATTKRPRLSVIEFFRGLRWLDGSPLLEQIEPYRLRLFEPFFQSSTNRTDAPLQPRALGPGEEEREDARPRARRALRARERVARRLRRRVLRAGQRRRPGRR